MRTILLVDDEPAVAHTLAYVFRMRNYKTLVAENGFEALRSAEKHTIDAALIDINMPEMEGFAVCGALCVLARDAGRRLPVWMMTGAPSADAIEKAKEAGALGILTKPFRFEALLREIEATLGETSGVEAVR